MNAEEEPSYLFEEQQASYQGTHSGSIQVADITPPAKTIRKFSPSFSLFPFF